jgi:hypothetical protein
VPQPDDAGVGRQVEVMTGGVRQHRELDGSRSLAIRYSARMAVLFTAF